MRPDRSGLLRLAAALVPAIISFSCNGANNGGPAPGQGGVDAGTSAAGDSGASPHDGGDPPAAQHDGGDPPAAQDDAGPLPPVPAGASKYAYLGPDGRLHYTPDGKGNRVPDFSNAGYMGGGVPLPDVAVKQTISPSAPGTSADDGPRIQAAIDAVSALPLDASGFRGAVLLTKGDYAVAGSITISASGVVLRGEGAGAGGTVILGTGTTQSALIQAVGSGTRVEVPNTRQAITDDYVPVGAHSFHVTDGSGYAVGDTVVIQRPSTQEWIDLVGMDSCLTKGTVYDTSDIDGPPAGYVDGQSCLDGFWLPGERDLFFDRVVTSVNGNQITVDAPLVNALEKEFGGAAVYKYQFAGRISQVGVESLRGDSVFSSPTDENHTWNIVKFSGVINGWVKSVSALHFGRSAVTLGSWSRRSTTGRNNGALRGGRPRIGT